MFPYYKLQMTFCWIFIQSWLSSHRRTQTLGHFMRWICVLIWSELLIVLFLWKTSESMQEDAVIHSALKFLEGSSFFFFFFPFKPSQELVYIPVYRSWYIHIFWIIAWMDFYLSSCIGIFSCVWCRSSFQLVCLRFHFCFKVFISIYERGFVLFCLSVA